MKDIFEEIKYKNRDLIEVATMLSAALTISSAMTGHPLVATAAAGFTAYSGLEFVKETIKSYK